MAPVNLDIPLIRNGRGKDVVVYFEKLQEQSHSDITICKSLLDAVDREHLSARVFSIFLPWSKNVEAIVLCLRSESSRFTQKKAAEAFGIVLSDPKRWQTAWSAAGGTQGLINLFAEMSVLGVKALARGIGRCNRGRSRTPAREAAMEEFLHALLPSHYPGSQLQSGDKRPIEDLYAQMLPACSPEFVEQVLDAEDLSNQLYRRLPLARLIKTHEEVLQKRVSDSLFGNGSERNHLRHCLEAFTYSHPSRPGPEQKVSASMAFSNKVLQHRVMDINDKRWPSAVSEADVLSSLLRRCLKRKVSQAKVHDVFLLGLQLLEAKPNLKPAFRSMDFWPRLMTHWKRVPDFYGDLLELALRLGLGGSQNSICRDFLQTSRNVQAELELRWPLLRMYCLHVPKKGIDIDATNDFTPLAKQTWSSDLFYYLTMPQAIRLLKCLQHVNPHYSFLQSSIRDSILSQQDIKLHQNFNVVLLLTILQRESKDTQQTAEKVVDELRKQAATAREQEDRAHFASAAASYAIASGNLQLYADTVIWQQRFVRDPLTVKVIFRRDAVMTGEGITLLAGIPEPLSEEISVGKVVKKANGILKTFHEIVTIAKREPSFFRPDWSGVRSLFGAAIRQRVAHAKILQEKHPEIDLYAEVWAPTLTMLEEVNVEFLNEAIQPIRNVLTTLPPTTLATTVKAMLESGIERRKRRDRQPADDRLENLSYRVLIELIKSDKPQLAQRLVLQTILDRPDASSWHRQFLNVSFMKSLSAKDAHKMLLAFATAIGEKLEEQSYVRVGETQPPPTALPQSLVKVTTVKHLAQLLDNAPFISAEAAVDVLVELFKAGTHRDIRLATLDSLLSLLNRMCSGADEKWRSNPLVEKIMGALETVIPVVGSINERRPPREEDWQEARETGTLPDLSDPSRIWVPTSLPPLMDAIFKAANGQKYPELESIQAEFVARLLLPILEHSQSEHKKWVSLFLAKHKANFTLNDLPPVPISPDVWDTLLREYSERIPQSLVEDYHRFIVIKIAQPAALRSFNESLEKDPEVSKTREAQHWLSIFGHNNRRFRDWPPLLLYLVHHDFPHSSLPNGIEFDRMADMIVIQASLILDKYENYTNEWDKFLQKLHHPLRSSYPFKDTDSIRSMVEKWKLTGRVVLEKVIAAVFDKKEIYVREQKRNILPSITELRLQLLPFPCFPDPAEIDDQCREFVKELVELLEDSLRGETNVLRWPKLGREAYTFSELLNTDEERLRIALHIGNFAGSSGDQVSSALNLVRIALAMKLIEDGSGDFEISGKGEEAERRRNLKVGLRKMVEVWQYSIKEEIREKVAEWKMDQRVVWKALMNDE